jgi:2-(1,2-epoxy-1,2-dihydrophenyl)acetyl-CoA isomerase
MAAGVYADAWPNEFLARYPAAMPKTNASGSTNDDIIFAVADGVLRITLNRPDMGNAVTQDQRRQFGEWIERANEDHTIRCVVLGATGRFFCTGADLSAPRDEAPLPEGQPERVVGDTRRMMLRGAIATVHSILDCEKPVIAAVQGTAAGIGCHLAFACDLVVAAESAKFIEIFARRGLAVDGLGSWLLPRLVGLQRAKELVFLADDVSAQRALEIGLVTRVVPDEELATTIDELAQRLAAGPTKAHMVNKWLLNRSFDVDRHTLAGEEAWIVDVMANTLDSGEGVASFLERRPPNFRGL